MSVAEPTVVLRPQLGRRMILFGCGIVVTVIGIGALTSGALIGIGALALGLFGLILGGARLFAPDAMVTEIGPAGFRVHDSFGRVQHDIRWDEVERFVEVAGNAPLRPGALRLVGWMLHQPTRARTRPFGHKVDGHLPEVYDGFDAVLGLMLRRANGGSSRLEAF